mgnify:CR=1 FL=1
MKKTVLIIVSTIVIVVMFTSCKSNDKQVDNTNLDTSFNGEIDTEESSTKGDVIYVTGTETTEPTTVEDTRVVICEKEIKGVLSYPNADREYSFIAPVDGRYHFDLDNKNKSSNYSVTILNYTENFEIETKEYNSYDNGITCTLNQGCDYSVLVKQISDCPEYVINIGIPEEKQTINGNSFDADLNYQDKINYYEYTPIVSGIYRFDFDIDSINNDYEIRIYDEKDKLIKSSQYSDYDKGITCALEKGETYLISAEQKKGTPFCTIKIGVPNLPTYLENGQISDSLTYYDQENIYFYNMNSGKYILSYKTYNWNAQSIILLYNSKNKKIFEKTITEDDISFTLDEPDEYKIVIKQYNDLCDYELKILNDTQK